MHALGLKRSGRGVAVTDLAFHGYGQVLITPLLLTLFPLRCVPLCCHCPCVSVMVGAIPAADVPPVSVSAVIAGVAVVANVAAAAGALLLRWLLVAVMKIGCCHVYCRCSVVAEDDVAAIGCCCFLRVLPDGPRAL